MFANLTAKRRPAHVPLKRWKTEKVGWGNLIELCELTPILQTVFLRDVLQQQNSELNQEFHRQKLKSQSRQEAEDSFHSEDAQQAGQKRRNVASDVEEQLEMSPYERLMREFQHSDSE